MTLRRTRTRRSLRLPALVVRGHRFKSDNATDTAVDISSSTSCKEGVAPTVENASTTIPSLAVTVSRSLAAAVLGLGTISFVAWLVETTTTTTTTAAAVPKYDPNGQRYDQGTYLGRFCRMMLTCDPRLLLYTKEQVLRKKEMIEMYNDDNDDDNDNDDNNNLLWEARRIVDAAVHPDTGDFVPRPFRMSGYVASNAPICVAMIVSQSTMPLLFWSWMNQSQNALVNYFNRNASSKLSDKTLLTSYGAAVGSALLVAFGLATFIQKRCEPTKAKMLLRWVAFPSSVVASSLNCYIVRSPELGTGIPLMDENGNYVLPESTSKIAAKRGVYSTVASRAMLQVPVYFVPPVLLSLAPIRRYLHRHPAMTVPVTSYLLLVCAGIGLPATIAIFPQISTIAANEVEPPYRHLRHPDTNQPYRVYYYNKGL